MTVDSPSAVSAQPAFALSSSYAVNLELLAPASIPFTHDPAVIRKLKPLMGW